MLYAINGMPYADLHVSINNGDSEESRMGTKQLTFSPVLRILYCIGGQDVGMPRHLFDLL